MARKKPELNKFEKMLMWPDDDRSPMDEIKGILNESAPAQLAEIVNDKIKRNEDPGTIEPFEDEVQEKFGLGELRFQDFLDEAVEEVEEGEDNLVERKTGRGRSPSSIDLSFGEDAEPTPEPTAEPELTMADLKRLAFDPDEETFGEEPVEDKAVFFEEEPDEVLDDIDLGKLVGYEGFEDKEIGEEKESLVNSIERIMSERMGGRDLLGKVVDGSDEDELIELYNNILKEKENVK